MNSTPPPPEGEHTGSGQDEDPREALRRANTSEADAAWRAVAYLLSGPLLYGALGWLADLWLGTNWVVGVGVVGGMALSLYLIWVRYGTH
ncbi:MAG: hypothetical protein M3520_02720 [Actinomycetota bacterium]|nr:hypothetical protein [Actinomycetota bacterium]